MSLLQIERKGRVAGANPYRVRLWPAKSQAKDYAHIAYRATLAGAFSSASANLKKVWAAGVRTPMRLTIEKRLGTTANFVSEHDQVYRPGELPARAA